MTKLESPPSVAGAGPFTAAALPDRVLQVAVGRGRILVRVAASVEARDLVAELGSAKVGFRPIADEEVARAGLRTRASLSFGDGPFVSAKKAQCRAHLNTLRDWALDGGQTLQIEIADPTTPFSVDLLPKFALPPSDVDRTFRVLLATHRGCGSLLLNMTGPTDRPRSFHRHFDVSKHGGTEPGDYDVFEIALPASDAEEVLAMGLRFDRALSAQDAPWFFIADPVLLNDRPPAETGAMLEFHADDGRAGAEPGAWYEASLPALLQPFETLSLVVAGDAAVLVPMSDATVSLVQDWGHSIQLSASVEGQYKLHMSHAEPMLVTLGTDPTTISIPRECLDGTAHLLQVTDPGECRLFYQDYLLLPRILTPVDVLQRESSPPFPSALMPQSWHRFQSVRAQIANRALSAADRIQIDQALATLEGGFGNVELKALRFPEVDAPDVSIVMPAHNKVEVTYLGLCSLLTAYNAASFEVILVDDASTDETSEIESFVSGIKVVRNAEPQRFIRAVNAGAAEARGSYVALLNNDVEVTTGWLDELVAAFDRFADVGLVGSKLLYPDGRLQEAGGIVWGSGNPWNYGHGQNPWEPRFCYARQADYLSGAALMTTREIWQEVGGLSSYLEPMYFEDTDLAFKVREAGYTTWCIPSSVVYHYEGMTSGTDTASGFKRFQEVNRPKFKRRWSQAFSRFGQDGQQPDLEKDRGIVGRVLVVDQGVPRPDRDAGSYAAIKEIELIRSLGYKVTFLPRNMAHMGRYTDDLQRMGVEVIYAPFYLSTDDYLAKHGAGFDAIYITRYYVALDLLDRVRTSAPGAKVILNNADLHFLRELRAGLAVKDDGKVAEAARTRDRELSVMRRVDAIASYNDVEHSVITSHIDGAVPVVKCPWVVDMPDEVPPPSARRGLSFLGNFAHPPNVEAVEWFVRSVMPLLRSAGLKLDFRIYGAGLPDRISALRDKDIHPEGFVETVSEAYDRSRIFVAPLLSGAGIKGKVLAALAHGVPTVMTPVAAEGIGLRHGHDCFIVEGPDDWAEAIARLQTDDTLWQAISDNSRSYVAAAYSFETGRERMRRIFETVDLYQSAR